MVSRFFVFRPDRWRYLLKGGGEDPGNPRELSKLIGKIQPRFASEDAGKWEGVSQIRLPRSLQYFHCLSLLKVLSSFSFGNTIIIFFNTMR